MDGSREAVHWTHMPQRGRQCIWKWKWKYVMKRHRNGLAAKQAKWHYINWGCDDDHHAAVSCRLFFPVRNPGAVDKSTCEIDFHRLSGSNMSIWTIPVIPVWPFLELPRGQPFWRKPDREAKKWREANESSALNLLSKFWVEKLDEHQITQTPHRFSQNHSQLGSQRLDGPKISHTGTSRIEVGRWNQELMRKST